MAKKDEPMGGPIRDAGRAVESAASNVDEFLTEIVRPLVAAAKENGIRVKLVRVNQNKLVDMVLKDAECPFELEVYVKQ